MKKVWERVPTPQKQCWKAVPTRCSSSTTFKAFDRTNHNLLFT